jgi:hypothetical protein
MTEVSEVLSRLTETDLLAPFEIRGVAGTDEIITICAARPTATIVEVVVTPSRPLNAPRHTS